MTSIILTGQTDTQKYQQFDHPTKLRYSIYERLDDVEHCYTPRNKVVGGYTGFTMSDRLSVRL